MKRFLPLLKRHKKFIKLENKSMNRSKLRFGISSEFSKNRKLKNRKSQNLVKILPV